MNNVLFTHSYFLHFDPKQWRTGLPYPPLGTLFAASLTRDNGFNVSFFDTMFAKAPEEIIPAIQDKVPDFFVIYDDGFNYLTKMCLTNMRNAAFEMIKYAKIKGCIVIVSSSDSTDHYKNYLEKGADFVLLGEAELTLVELIQSLNNNEKKLHNIPGIAFWENGVPTKNEKRAVLKNLDLLPLPAWDLLNIATYRDLWIKNKGYFSINIATTRGCPYKCNWCAKPIYGNRYNTRSPQNVIKEIKLLQQKFDFDHIWFCDDIFGLKPGWIHEFTACAKEEQLKLNFKIQCRADLLVQENYVKDLAIAGCSDIWMGAESGSQKILDAMEKGTTVEQIYEATHLLKRYNIKPSFFIQFGYPGETKHDIEKTIKMINDLLPSDIGISVSYPLPGTRFYETVASQLHDKANWSDSDDLAMMFKNTFQPEFYRQLHRYVHAIYRKHLAMDFLHKMLETPSKMNLMVLKKISLGAYYSVASFFSKLKLNRLAKPTI
jgi:anaerobic magnesium-protoporphyrin IX monomethyl ester cyclase